MDMVRLLVHRKEEEEEHLVVNKVVVAVDSKVHQVDIKQEVH